MLCKLPFSLLSLLLKLFKLLKLLLMLLIWDILQFNSVVFSDKETNYVCCMKHENAKLSAQYVKDGEQKTFVTSADGQTSIVPFGQPGGPENCASDFFINWAPLE